MASLEKLYSFHAENLRAVGAALDHVARVGRVAIARNNKREVDTSTRLFAFLLAAWLETRLQKLLHEPNAFSGVQREELQTLSAAERWMGTAEAAVRKHFGIATGPLKAPAMPKTAELRYAELVTTLQTEIRPISELRNKLAHGQWVYPLNTDGTAVSQSQFDALRRENLFTLIQRRSLGDALCSTVNDLAVSKPTFERDYDRHARVVAQIRINLHSRSYDKWTAQIRERGLRGRALRDSVAYGSSSPD